MMKKALLALGALLLVFFGVVASRPEAAHYERSRTIPAAPELVFAIVNDFHNWPAWSPWEKMDPTMKKSFSGAELGKGSVYEWSGNEKVGKGRMTLEESVPPTRIQMKLEFLEPFAATNQVTFAFAPDGAGTKLTWSMDGKNNFVMKAFTMFANMDAQIGGDFEAGLASLETLAVERARKQAEEAEAKAKAQAEAQAEAPAPAAP